MSQSAVQPDARPAPHTYKQSHSPATLATHSARTATSDAAFLLPHLFPSAHILDVGCGPGTITLGLAASLGPSGSIVGVDISAEVLAKAQTAADKAAADTANSKANVSFVLGNVLDKLPFDDEIFDVVFASQLLGHIPLPDLPVKALTEMRRVLKPGGILATRDALETHAYPRSLGLELERVFFERQWRAIQGSGPGEERTSMVIPGLLRRAGFEEGNVKVGGSVRVLATEKERRWLVGSMVGRLEEGGTLHKNWLEVGYTDVDVEEAVDALERWAGTEDAWYLSSQVEVLAWK
jgi:ubiquinone/menaquinone biosynthesis C-methylase UbiE